MKKPKRKLRFDFCTDWEFLCVGVRLTRGADGGRVIYIHPFPGIQITLWRAAQLDLNDSHRDYSA